MRRKEIEVSNSDGSGQTGVIRNAVLAILSVTLKITHCQYKIHKLFYTLQLTGGGEYARALVTLRLDFCTEITHTNELLSSTSITALCY